MCCIIYNMIELIGAIIGWICNAWKFIWENNIAAAAGGVFAIIQFVRGNHNNKLNNELTGAPRFYFTRPTGCTVYNNSECSGGDFTPELIVGCSGERRVCWFGLANMGRFAARGVKIAIAKEDELNDIFSIPDDRWKYMDYWSGNTTDSIANAEIARITTPLGRFELTSKDQNLYILLEYKSDYANIRYKYLYQWCITDNGDIIFGIPPVDWEEMDKMREEYASETGLSKESMCRLSKIALSISEPQPDVFEKMGFSRPVFLREVRTVKAVSSNKVHWWTKIRTKRRCKASRKITKDDWLKYF